MSGVPFLPASASTVTSEFDFLFVGLLAVTGAVLVLVVLLVAVFCFRYRGNNTEADRNHRIKKSWHWEVGWTAASFVVFLGLYAWGADLYLREHHAPGGAQDVYVVGKQWMWKIEHADGQREIDALHVAANQPVRLVMTSQDVIHSFFVPAFRLKQDVVPGRYTTMWFSPTKTGTYHIFCAQFCGTAHAEMGGSVIVSSEGDFQKWLAANATTGTLASEGGALYRRLGCSGCHGESATVGAPRLVGLYGRPVALRDGGMALADENFLRDAILEPGKRPPAGYPTIMPSFTGQVDEEQVVSLVAYLKSLDAKTVAQ
jgi:cytochrome c oxidase subunit 2